MSWRWCYYVNIIDVGLAIIFLFFFYHPPTFELLHERKTKREIMKDLDYLGIFLWTAGLTVFLMGVSFGGKIYPWKSAATISSIVIGLVLLIALFLYESFADLKYPAIPVKFFANRGFISLVCCATVASMVNLTRLSIESSSANCFSSSTTARFCSGPSKSQPCSLRIEHMLVGCLAPLAPQRLWDRLLPV